MCHKLRSYLDAPEEIHLGRKPEDLLENHFRRQYLFAILHLFAYAAGGGFLLLPIILSLTPDTFLSYPSLSSSFQLHLVISDTYCFFTCFPDIPQSYPFRPDNRLICFHQGTHLSLIHIQMCIRDSSPPSPKILHS